MGEGDDERHGVAGGNQVKDRGTRTPRERRSDDQLCRAVWPMRGAEVEMEGIGRRGYINVFTCCKKFVNLSLQ